MAFDSKDYPPNWFTEIRPSILERATDSDGVTRCEWCGIPNHEHGARDKSGEWHSSYDISFMKLGGLLKLFGTTRPRIIQIVLTIAHIHDMDKMNCEPGNLAALCQKCHLNHDRPHHIAKRKANARRRAIEEQRRNDKQRGQLSLFTDSDFEE